MTLKDIQTQALNLPIQQKWQLVQTLLNAIQQETQTSPPMAEETAFEHLHPWTKSLIGVIQHDEDVQEQYINYLEEKYR